MSPTCYLYPTASGGAALTSDGSPAPSDRVPGLQDGTAGQSLQTGPKPRPQSLRRPAGPRGGVRVSQASMGTLSAGL